MRRSSAALVAAITMLAASACSGREGEPTGLATDDLATTGAPTDGPTGDPANEPTDAPPTDQPSATAEASPDDEAEGDPTSDEAVIADYRAARDAYIAAYDPPDPENAGLLEWHDGNALDGYQSELEGLASEGHSEIIEYDLHPEVVLNRNGSDALVNDCYDVTVTTTDTESGEPVGEVMSYTRNTDFSLELRDGQWIIVNYNHVESECTPGG